jgi:UDP-glucuronate 4-epimerase
MQTVLVTGGAGFIGSHLVERLLSQGRRVVCLDNFDPFYPPAQKWRNLDAARRQPLFSLVEGDLRDERVLDRIFQTTPIDAVVHLAALAGVRPSLRQPGLYNEVNVGGTLSLLEVVCRHRVQNFVFASSSSVYGIRTQAPFREEEAAEQPVSPYAATKRAGELICYTYHHLYALPITCLRLFTVYGPRQRPDLAIHTFARHLLAGEAIPIFGDGTTSRDYTFVADIVSGVVAALDRPHPYEIINLGNSRPVLLRDLVATLADLFGVTPRLLRLPEQPGDVALTCADVAKAQRLLDYQPRVDLREGLSHFRDWFIASAGDQMPPSPERAPSAAPEEAGPAPVP